MSIFLTILGVIFVLFILFVFFIFVVPSVPMFNGSEYINKALSNQFYYKRDKVVYVSGGNFFSLGDYEIEGADKESFEVLSYNYAKDTNHVYYEKTILKEMKPENIELLSPYTHENKKSYLSYSYIKNDQKVFYLYEPIEEADAQSFSYLQGSYARDKDALFYADSKITNIENSLTFLDNDSDAEYIKMGHKIFYRGEITEIKEPERFKLLSEDFSSDGKTIYYHAQACPEIDSASFEVINNHFEKDKNSLYFEAIKIKDSDPLSFETINNYFTKDKNQVYYFSNILMHEDAKTFDLQRAESLDDIQNLFMLHYDDAHVMYAKRTNLRHLSRSYTQYKSDIYVTNTRLIGATADDFKILGDEDSLFAQSLGKTFYFNSEIIKADFASFEPINDNFSKDKDRVYWMAKELVDVKPDEFIYEDGMYGDEINEHQATLTKHEGMNFWSE